MRRMIRRLREWAYFLRYREDDPALHPWYGGCDGFAGNWRCAECMDVRMGRRPTQAELIAEAMSSKSKVAPR